MNMDDFLDNLKSLLVTGGIIGGGVILFFYVIWRLSVNSPYYISYQNNADTNLKIIASTEDDNMPHGNAIGYEWKENQLVITFER